MNRAVRQARWTDDWLDLHNYASKIGDEEWRLSILHQLQSGDSPREQELMEQRREQLQHDLEEVSRKMEGIYLRLRDAESGSIRSSLWNAAWQLKKERARLASLLRGSEAGAGRQRGHQAG
ncbi:hypothetical protein [Paenibacillus herberti]|uniref:Uncharacterized protein n=1 Tax=Paenibacillus herberti TaxID=1619309 RepID=A0A229NWP8_9BACL|nr:hypothetical protein [Paenibacillus herberti]OXM14310.1 hypothetical protein CGZ75_15260 [Paenibacillus herberti]